MAKYLAGVDVGTTGARCAIFDLEGNAVGGAYRGYGATYPKPGWVEQDADELIPQTFAACAAAVADAEIDPAEIAAIGFSTQRSVTCPVDAAGRPVRPMLSWQDARPAEEVAWMGGKIAAGRGCWPPIRMLRSLSSESEPPESCRWPMAIRAWPGFRSRSACPMTSR